MPGTPFVVDKFGPTTTGVPCQHWFLTHFHADHYGGLCPRWCQRNKGNIYCTTPTAKLAAERLKVCCHLPACWAQLLTYHAYPACVPYRCL